MLVQDIMSKAELVLSPGWTVGDAAKECAARDFFIAPVADGGKYCGVLRVEFGPERGGERSRGVR